MNPCELNLLVTAITNHLYTALSDEDFYCLSIFLSELSRSMYTTERFKVLCGRDKNSEHKD